MSNLSNNAIPNRQQQEQHQKQEPSQEHNQSHLISQQKLIQHQMKLKQENRQNDFNIFNTNSAEAIMTSSSFQPFPVISVSTTMKYNSSIVVNSSKETHDLKPHHSQNEQINLHRSPNRARDRNLFDKMSSQDAQSLPLIKGVCITNSLIYLPYTFLTNYIYF